MKVSVCMITYNHAKFIAQAIESALMQETNFDYEIIVGDDCSTDGTREIIQEYAAKHPDKIKTLLHPQNLGPAHSPGKYNLVLTLESCQGEYVALLEGDDYWIDPHKMQKQVDFLENHLAYSMCCHNAQTVDELGRVDVRIKHNMPAIIDLKDFMFANPIPTCSVMFRRMNVLRFPRWFFEISVGDWGLYILNAQKGKIRYIDECMSVYRLHSMSYWSSQPAVDALIKIIKDMHIVRPYLNPEYQKVIDAALYRRYLSLALAYLDVGQLERAKFYAKRCFAETRNISPVPIKFLIQALLRIYTPKLYKVYRSVKDALST